MQTPQGRCPNAPKFIKLGERILGLAHVVSIDFYVSKANSLEARVTLTGQFDDGNGSEPRSMTFGGKWAEALADYFNTDVAPRSFRRFIANAHLYYSRRNSNHA
ncbi:hypothetical protein [Gloeobacter kilaueensis]|uniref:Uncharacterized protein n=1 Tax=Gloeobacter kilaueensis (strain ATCC BAA-2537 / CCAP 1431/1 / ULC 316 / JS1) TaxID=1183438 RepID=U5QQT3_GLOK1|nr:hypothetical protein [Gloeobacter kilaueensis]AGY60060.1 hypothetical protein GKIL_3814 [Gloeobacter kilaueensis JS1]